MINLQLEMCNLQFAISSLQSLPSVNPEIEDKADCKLIIANCKLQIGEDRP